MRRCLQYPEECSKNEVNLCFFNKKASIKRYRSELVMWKYRDQESSYTMTKVCTAENYSRERFASLATPIGNVVVGTRGNKKAYM